LKEYNKIPKTEEKYTYKGVEFLIGSFWICVKQGINKDLYNEYLSKISIFKEDYDRVQKLKEEKKNKGVLTSLEKIEALIEYNKIPKTKEKYTYKGVEFLIGSFWIHIKQGINKDLYNEHLSKIIIFKEHYERLQKLKEEKKDIRELTPLEKIEALIEYNKIPKTEEKYTYKGIKFQIGIFWDSIKQGKNKKLYEQYLSKISIFKENYERVQKLKVEKKLKKKS
jgi:hypothetical protein